MKWPRHNKFKVLLPVLVCVLLFVPNDLRAVDATKSSPVPGASSTPLPKVNPAEVAELKKKISLKPNDTDSRLKLAQIYQSQNQWPEVIATLRPAADSLSRAGFILLAKAYREKKEQMEEIRTLEIAVGKTEKDYVLLSLLGDAYSRFGKSETATEKFEAAREANADYQPAYQGLATEFEKSGANEEARGIYEQMIKKFGERKEFLNSLCRLLQADAFIEKGIEACQKATEHNPSFPDNFVYLALLQGDDDHPEKGEKAVRETAKKFPNSDFAQKTAAKKAVEKKQWREAAEFFLQCTVANPKADECFVGLADSFFEIDKYPEALAAFKRACGLSRKHIPEFRRVTGLLRFKKKSEWVVQFESGLSACGS